MKNVFCTILLFSAITCLFYACTGGNYDANPGSNANYVVNPAEPLKASQFTWGTGAVGSMGGVINGTSWATNNVSWSLDTGTNEIYGILGSQVMYLHLNNVYGGTIYSLGYTTAELGAKQYSIYSDSVNGVYNVYYSFYGNSGEVYITENDSAFIKGMFYCEDITASGQITAINNGYFNIAKP